MRRSWLDDTDGGWVAHRLQLVTSPAWRLAPIPLRRVLERLEIEHMRHGGKENGHLVVSYGQFEKFSVSRKSIRGALELGEKLGLLEIRQESNWVGDIRPPNQYRLTYVPENDRRAPTDEWAGLTEEKVKSIIGGKHAKTDSQCPFDPSTSALSAHKDDPTSALFAQSPVVERELSSISARKGHSDSGERSQSVAHTQSDATAQEPTPLAEALTNVLSGIAPHEPDRG